MKCYMEKVLLSDSDDEDEINYIGDISDTSSDSEFAESSSSSEEEEQCNCDHYKSILKLNGLSINMLRQEDSLILDSFVFEGEALIDSGADLNCISEDLLNRLYDACIFSKFDMKSGYWQIQIAEVDKFLGSLNYLVDFYKDLAKDAKPLFARLKKSPGSWTEACTKAVQKIKSKAKELPCLAIPHPDAFKIVETDASDYGYGGILKHDLYGKTSLEAALPSNTKRVSADSSSSNLMRVDDGYKRTTRTLASFIKAEHWGSDLELIAQIYLRDHLSPTIDSQKSRQWFETILMETGCARITHYYKSNKQISYSKLIILDVFSHQDWGDNLFSKQKFKDSRAHPGSYNFFDYVQAWNEVLNYQNISYGHSWFIKLSITTKDFSRAPIPCWFQQWLLQFGIIGDALPECVLETSNKFYQHNQKKVPIEFSFLYFLVLYQVPWIIKWEYQFNEDSFSLEAEKGQTRDRPPTNRNSKNSKAIKAKHKPCHRLQPKESTKPHKRQNNIPLTPNSIDSSRKHNTHHPPTKLPTAEMARPKNSILPAPSTQR
ncbi:hypothetical protein ACOSQ3_031808 [Xanthoceras sorbifolium]